MTDGQARRRQSREPRAASVAACLWRGLDCRLRRHLARRACRRRPCPQRSPAHLLAWHPRRHALVRPGLGSGPQQPESYGRGSCLGRPGGREHDRAVRRAPAARQAGGDVADARQRSCSQAGPADGRAAGGDGRSGGHVRPRCRRQPDPCHAAPNRAGDAGADDARPAAGRARGAAGYDRGAAGRSPGSVAGTGRRCLPATRAGSSAPCLNPQPDVVTGPPDWAIRPGPCRPGR